MANDRKFDLEKIGGYIAIAGFLFMFWQAWRDIHKDAADIRERIAKLEVKFEHLETNHE